MSDDVAFALRTKKDSTGFYLWRDNDDMIFSRTVYISPFMPDIAAGKKVIVFGDFRYFWLVEHGITTIQPLFEKYTATGHVGYIGSERNVGRLTRRDAVKVLQMVAE